MVRSTLFILAAIVAVVFGFDQAGEPVAVAAKDPGISVRLTQAETDCIVGGDAGCWSVAKEAAGDCLNEGLVSGDIENTGDIVDCYAYGGWVGVVCAFNWFLNLF